MYMFVYDGSLCVMRECMSIEKKIESNKVAKKVRVELTDEYDRKTGGGGE